MAEAKKIKSTRLALNIERMDGLVTIFAWLCIATQVLAIASTKWYLLPFRSRLVIGNSISIFRSPALIERCCYCEKFPDDPLCQVNSLVNPCTC